MPIYNRKKVYLSAHSNSASTGENDLNHAPSTTFAGIHVKKARDKGIYALQFCRRIKQIIAIFIAFTTKIIRLIFALISSTIYPHCRYTKYIISVALCNTLIQQIYHFEVAIGKPNWAGSSSSAALTQIRTMYPPQRTIRKERSNVEYNVQLKISYLMNPNVTSSTTKRRRMAVHSYPEPFLHSPNPNYGDLKLNFLPTQAKEPNNFFGRILKDDPEALVGNVYTTKDYEDHWRNFDKYYAFDDDEVRNTPFQDSYDQCRRVSWHRLYNPTCNTIHEIELVPLIHDIGDNYNKFLGEGSYRAAFFVQGTSDNELVLKVQRYTDKNYAHDRYEFVRMDALVMERLTSSPHIVDIYSHCAMSVLTEFLPVELEGIATPYYSRKNQRQLVREQKKEKNKFKSLNNLTDEKKLDISLQMAEAIATLHGFKDGILIHDDIQLPQFLITAEDKVKLNDFNRAEAMLYDESKGDYCRYLNGAGGGDWRAPEEWKDGRLNQKIDVWSFGNNVYSLMTGLYPFYEDNEYEDMQNKMKNGETQVIESDHRNGSYVERSLVQVIEKCWIYEPDERAEIFDIVKQLRKVKDRLKSK